MNVISRIEKFSRIFSSLQIMQKNCEFQSFFREISYQSFPPIPHFESKTFQIRLLNFKNSHLTFISTEDLHSAKHSSRRNVDQSTDPLKELGRRRKRHMDISRIITRCPIKHTQSTLRHRRGPKFHHIIKAEIQRIYISAIQVPLSTSKYRWR